MPNFDDPQALTRPQHMSSYGDETAIHGAVVVPSSHVLADVIRPVLIPAGTMVHSIILANTDMDTNASPLLAFSMGFLPRTSLEGPLVANAAYFAPAGQADLRAPNDGKLFANFAPIKFDQDVWLTITLTAGAATAAGGTVRVRVLGEVVGVK